MSLLDLGGGRGKGENCSWNLYSRYCLSRTSGAVLAELAELGAARGRGQEEFGARSWGTLLVEILYFKDSHVGMVWK